MPKKAKNHTILGGIKVNSEQLSEWGSLGGRPQKWNSEAERKRDERLRKKQVKFGKEVGGDIRQNKKTFLAIHTWEVAGESQKKKLADLALSNDASKVSEVFAIMKECSVDEWAKQLKEAYYKKALFHLEEIAVMSRRKVALSELAQFLLQREHWGFSFGWFSDWWLLYSFPLFSALKPNGNVFIP